MNVEQVRSQSSVSPMRQVLGVRDFRLLWLGQATSFLGDQFHFIAAPWLVLQLTDDPRVLGAVLALGGIPRAVFVLIGGAFTDRFSSRTVMLVTDIVRLIVTALLAALVFTGQIQVWMLYVFSLVFGVVSGFFMPASMSIVPMLVRGEQLQAANSLVQGATQLIAFLGPMAAGALIAYASIGMGAGGESDTAGIGLAFVVDTATFAVSIVTLWLMHPRPAPQPAERVQGIAGVLASVRSGLLYAWRDPLLRLVLTVVSAVNLLFLGPLVVGIPVLADQRLDQGAAAFGLIMAAYAAGNLGGILAAGAMPKLVSMATLSVALVALFGVALCAFGFVTATWTGFAIMLVLGLGNGYLSIQLITHMQRRTPPDFLGRIMSLMLFANVGLAPISQALSGVILSVSIAALFIAAGMATLGVAIWMVIQPALTLIDEEIA